MAFTSDNRPHVMGDLIAITGTVENGDTTIDLSDYLSEILSGTCHALSVAGTSSVCTINGTSVVFSDPSRPEGARLFVLGRR